MNELTLCIVNEGAGYQERLKIARDPRPVERFYMWGSWVRAEAAAQGRAPFTVQEMAQAVVELEDYYQRHLAEAAAVYRVVDPDGKERMVGTHDECFTYILRHHVLKYGGWAIQSVNNLPDN